MPYCKKCKLPSKAPNADIDQNGICSFCRQHKRTGQDSRQDSERKKREVILNNALNECKGQGEYDCLLCFSGGKDSMYLLHKLKYEYKLNVLAFTVDKNLPKIAWKNIRRNIKELNVNHIIYTPQQEFQRKLYRFLLLNQEKEGAVWTVCNVCQGLMYADAMRLAVQKGIPLILTGLSPDEPDPEDMLFSRQGVTRSAIRESGLFTDQELAYFWNAENSSLGTRVPQLIAVFQAWEYNQEKIMNKVWELGLIEKRRHGSPVHTNCTLNWLLMFSDLMNLGYNPYAPGFADMIRSGKASRRYWRVAQPIVNFMIRNQVLLGKHVSKSLEWLGLTPTDLHIN